jgi:pilus assembly protein Flp/PilA
VNACNPEGLDPGFGLEPGTDDCNWRLTMTFVNKLIRDEAGATAIEYGLIAALIAVAAIAAMQGLGNQLKATFNSTSSGMASAA